jgi:hypothetical protein
MNEVSLDHTTHPDSRREDELIEDYIRSIGTTAVRHVVQGLEDYGRKAPVIIGNALKLIRDGVLTMRNSNFYLSKVSRHKPDIDLPEQIDITDRVILPLEDQLPAQQSS